MTDKHEDVVVEHADYNVEQPAELSPKSPINAEAAREAAENERALGLIASARLYPKAIMFSMIMSLGIVMEGKYRFFLLVT